MDPYELIIFDLDGTLADRDTGALLPGVKAWFETHGDRYRYALATNQGGVGLRYWMESGGFGEPDNFPTEDQIRERIDNVIAAIGVEMSAFICFAYESKKSGKWSPAPDGCEDDPEWDRNNRKPRPGLLLRAVRECKTTRRQTLFVGNGSEDQQAADRAEIAFADADMFFERRAEMPF